MSYSFAIRVVTVVFALLPVASAAESDALSIDAAIQARHLPYGTILDPVLSLPRFVLRGGLLPAAGIPRCGPDITSLLRHIATPSQARPMRSPTSTMRSKESRCCWT